MNLLNITEGSLVEVTKASNWYSWLDQMPPPPNGFHVIGDVEVPNPGVIALLTPKVPQGINPTILFLDLILLQRPGYWPQVITTAEARYDKVVQGSPYNGVVVYSNDEAIAEIPVAITS